MQLTLQEPSITPSINRSFQGAEPGIGFRKKFDGRQDRREGTADDVILPDYEPVEFEELIEELMEFRQVAPELLRGIERKCSVELGPRRFAQLKQLLFRAWAGDRMI